MQIDRKLVEKLASLAKLSLSPEESDLMAGHLTSILNYTEKLQEVDTTNAVVEIRNDLDVFQPDQVVEFENSEKLIDLFPEVENNLLKVKSIKK